MVEFFKPSGRILEPCKGDGVFLKYLPSAEWCEIQEGRDSRQGGRTDPGDRQEILGSPKPPFPLPMSHYFPGHLPPDPRESEEGSRIGPVWIQGVARLEGRGLLPLATPAFADFDFNSGSVTFTAGCAKRNAPGPFTAGLITQGNWPPDTAIHDFVRTSSGGSEIGTGFHDYFDAHQGTVSFWLTPEWSTGDILSQVRLFDIPVTLYMIVYNNGNIGVNLYGTEIDKVLTLATENSGYTEKINNDGEIVAQVVYAIRNEMAKTLTDILLRRTGIGTLGHPGKEVVKKIDEVK